MKELTLYGYIKSNGKFRGTYLFNKVRKVRSINTEIIEQGHFIINEEEYEYTLYNRGLYLKYGSFLYMCSNRNAHFIHFCMLRQDHYTVELKQYLLRKKLETLKNKIDGSK